MSSYKGYYGVRPAYLPASAAAAFPLNHNYQYIPHNAKNFVYQTVKPTSLAHPHNVYVHNAAALAQYNALAHGYPYYPYSSIASAAHLPSNVLPAEYASVAAANYGLPSLAAKHYGYYDYPYYNGLYHPFGYQPFGLPVVKASNDNNNSNANQESNNQESN